MAKLQAWRVAGSNLSRAEKNCLSSKIYRQLLGPTQPLIQCVPVVFPPKYTDNFWGPHFHLFSAYRLSFLQNIQTTSGAHTATYSVRTGSSLRRVKRLRTEANRTHLCNAEVKDAWSCAFSSPLHLHGVESDNFTSFTFISRMPIRIVVV